MDGITTSINAILKNLIKNFNTLLDCPVRFSGEYNEQKVHCFVEYIEHYKRVKCIADDQALQELQYLLLDQAYDWWLRRKGNLYTWSEALTILENQYSKKRPANVVYTEILKQHYDDYESKDDFVDDKNELFNELSEPELKDKNKLEIIYALLPNEIQNKVKLVSIKSIKDLKEQLKLAKLDTGIVSSNKENTTSNSNTTPEVNVVPAENGYIGISSNHAIRQKNTSVSSIYSEIESSADFERDQIIKVRRTEDLMPQDVKDEEQSPMLQEEFSAKDKESLATKNTLQSNQDNFQIDTDIMNQINNIIYESELNMTDTNTPEVSSQLSNGNSSLELLGLQVEPRKQPNKSPDHQNKSPIETNKKIKKRCSYCRSINHTSQMCFKRAKQMKLHPEKFISTKSEEGNYIFRGINNKDQMNISNSNSLTTTAQPTLSPSTTPMYSNQILTASTSQSTVTATALTNTTLILNNTTEKYVNSTLSTKLIAPINGKSPNKILATKLGSINTHYPKCHQCGTLGYYKSICPNCSPIYNNNNQYNK